MDNTQNKQTYTINDLLELRILLDSKYDSVDDWSKNEYKNYWNIANNILENSGLTLNELTLILDTRFYDIFTAVNTYHHQLIDMCRCK